jgi:hypothetical protein
MDARKPDEPTFVLRASDPHAVSLVWLWAALHDADGDHTNTRAAREYALEMMAWSTNHDKPIQGIGQAALIAVMEMIRALDNTAVRLRDRTAPQTNAEMVRELLCKLRMQDEEAAPCLH